MHPRTTLALLLALSACTSVDDKNEDPPTPTATPEPTPVVDTDTDVDPPVELTFTIPVEHPDAAFMAVTGTSANDVWIAGARPAPQMGPVLLHHTAEGIEEVDTGQLHDLWWVHALDDGTIYAAGGGATVLEIIDGNVERMATPRFFGHTIFGLWGSDRNDLWAVGGFAGRQGFIWHYDGTDWTPADLPDDLARTSDGEIPAMFKVWGRSATDVWAVGGMGTVLHYDGSDWEIVPSGTTASLFTVTGDDNEVVIVGGGAEGELLRGDADGLVSDTPDLAPLLQGVTIDRDGTTWVSGAQGYIARQPAGEEWEWLPQRYPVLPSSLHAAWAAPDGHIWTVGGGVLSPALDKGLVVTTATVDAWEPEPTPEPDLTCPADRVDIAPDESIARRWNELLLDSIRRDIPHPPVHARNLFHSGGAMWDAWATYDADAESFVYTDKTTGTDADRDVAISYAAYRLLSHRYANAIGAETTLDCYDRFMGVLGLDPAITTVDGDSPEAVGNRIGQAIIDRFANDGANEANNYEDTTGWAPTNPVMVVDRPGTPATDPDIWQQLNLGTAETQNGIVLETSVQPYIGAHWREVEPFAITRDPATGLYADTLGPYPAVADPDVVDQVVEVIRKAAELDIADGVMIDVGPAHWGNNTLGTNDGTGYAANPVTGLPYEDNLVPRGDFTRLVAELWADGPTSETPPGHWVDLGNDVSDMLDADDLRPFDGEVVPRLQWDVGLYLAMGAAAHDAAISAWELKRDSLGPRPITLIRWMGQKGQRSDPSLPSYDPDGLPLEDGLIELITEETTAAGGRHEHLRWHVGEIAVWGWPGEPGDRLNDETPLQWMRAKDWIPYQRRTFVTPAFPGFVSGHSTFSRSAAEVLTAYTGSPWFPGGFHEYVIAPRSFLKFESGPSTEVRLQWASYYDAADQAGQSRLWGGIHIWADDYIGRIAGQDAGFAVTERARSIIAPE